MIHYSGPSKLGRTLMVATEKGICGVAFAESQIDLEIELSERWPDAERGVIGAPQEIWWKALLTYLAAPKAKATWQLDLQGTEFQLMVWKALLAIPFGETRTYTQLAKAVGKPKSVRAVAAACGANPIAALVPCHRVIGAKGELTGYRWGVDRKRKMLAREGVVLEPVAVLS